MKKYIVCIILMSVAAVSLLGRFSGNAKTAVSGGSDAVLRIVAYNVGVFSKYTDDSMQDVADMMRELGADAVAVCELDSCNRRHGTFQLKDFAEALSTDGFPVWDYRYASAMQWNGGSYGIGVVSRTPIADSFVIRLPKGEGHEPRACMVIVTDAYVMAAVHLDHKNEDVRMEQARVVTDELKSRYGRSRKPVFLCGDFNTVPDSPTLRQLSGDWTVVSEQALTYPAQSPRKCIDYIMALNNRARYEVMNTSVCTGLESADVRETSDHLPVFADVKIR